MSYKMNKRDCIIKPKKAIQAQVQPVVRRWWKWICEFCFKKSNHKILPMGWDLVWQSAVCPNCQKRVQRDGDYSLVKGGAYAKSPDPRSV